MFIKIKNVLINIDKVRYIKRNPGNYYIKYENDNQDFHIYTEGQDSMLKYIKILIQIDRSKYIITDDYIINKENILYVVDNEYIQDIIYEDEIINILTEEVPFIKTQLLEEDDYYVIENNN